LNDFTDFDNVFSKVFSIVGGGLAARGMIIIFRDYIIPFEKISYENADTMLFGIYIACTMFATLMGLFFVNRFSPGNELWYLAAGSFYSVYHATYNYNHAILCFSNCKPEECRQEPNFAKINDVLWPPTKEEVESRLHKNTFK